MITCKVVAAWWFWAWMGTHLGFISGPFETQAQCEKIRNAMMDKGSFRGTVKPPCVSDK